MSPFIRQGLWQTVAFCYISTAMLTVSSPVFCMHLMWSLMSSLTKTRQLQKNKNVPVMVCCGWLNAKLHTVWGGNLFQRFCYMFSESSPCLLWQHGSCSTAQQPGELSENILKNFGTSCCPKLYHFENFETNQKTQIRKWSWFSKACHLPACRRCRRPSACGRAPPSAACWRRAPRRTRVSPPFWNFPPRPQNDNIRDLPSFCAIQQIVFWLATPLWSRFVRGEMPADKVSSYFLSVYRKLCRLRGLMNNTRIRDNVGKLTMQILYIAYYGYRSMGHFPPIVRYAL